MWIFKEYQLLSIDEHKQLLHVRNKSHIREASKDTKIIKLQNHLQWVDRLNTTQRYFAVIIDNKIVGGANFTCKQRDVLEWGIFFSNDTLPFISTAVTYIFIQKMFQNFDTLYSEVSKDNRQALRFNRLFLLEIYDESESYFHLKLTKELWVRSQSKLGIITKRLPKIEYHFLEYS